MERRPLRKLHHRPFLKFPLSRGCQTDWRAENRRLHIVRGSVTSCYPITVKADPKSYTPGPWCPGNIADGAKAGGIWMHDGEVYDVDAAVISNLAQFCGDTAWQLFDPETGNVRFTGSLEACEAAARPYVDPTYQNYCVQCLPEYMQKDATMTYVIPLQPQASGRPQPTNSYGSGVA